MKRPMLKAATGLYNPVDGAWTRFCIISNMLHIRDPFFKIKKYLQIRNETCRYLDWKLHSLYPLLTPPET